MGGEMLFCLNENWSFRKEGDSSKKVNLPHDAMQTEKRDPYCRNNKQSGFFPGGKYIYEKHFNLDKSDIGKCIEIHFKGVYQNSDVVVNNVKFTGRKYGFVPFTIDISDAVRAGENTLIVNVDNSLEPNCRWYSGSGIYRSVQLEIRDKCHIKRVNIETLSINPAVVRIIAETTLNCEIAVDIYDNEKMIISGNIGEFTIPNPKLWSAEHPFLYTCLIRTNTDERKILFGIRKLEWSANTGLLINNEEVLLRGGCIHQDNGVLGACIYPDSEERKVRILKEAGYNAIRCAHNPASFELLNACDKLGMYVLDEAFDMWYIPKNYHDYARYFQTEWKKDIFTMVENCKNHPSVIMYSIGNEVSETATKKGVETCKQLADYVRSLDSTRPVTAGINVLLNVYARAGFGVYKDKGDYKAKPLEPVNKKIKEKKTGSAFFNSMIQKLGPLMFLVSKGRKGDKASKGAAKSLDILGLNYAASRYDYDVVKYPERMIVGAETIIKELPYNWERVKKHKAIIGDFAWAAWDYLGEACIGDWTYHSYKGLPLLAGSGAIDITGKIGAEAYFQQVVWGLRTKPFIGIHPLNHAHEIPSKSAWRFTDCIDSWNWQGYEGVQAIVEIYSNSEFVRLSLNGKEIGTKKVKKFRTLFKTKYQNGILMAEALDSNKKVISVHSLVSGSIETILSVRPDKRSIYANGIDLCFIEIEFTDKGGNIKPFIEEKVELEITGPAVLAGFGSALAKTDEVFDKQYHNSYRGRTIAVLRAGYKTGKTIIEVKSSGVQSVTLEIEVQ